jgi:hypothetical protein
MRLFLILVVLAACGRSLDRKRLYAAVKDLAAVAAEVRLLLVEEPRGLPGAYGEQQRRDLAKRAREALVELAHGVDDPGLEPVRRRASEVGVGLNRIVIEAREPGALDPLLRQLQALANEARP